MTPTISDEQQLFSLVEALEEAAIAADSAFTEYGPADGGESQARLSAARLALLEHVRQRDPTIADLRTELDAIKRSREQEGQYDSMCYELQQAQAQLAELRNPVAVELNPDIEAVRARLSRSIEHSYEDHMRSLRDVRVTLSAYDTIAQNHARAVNAREMIAAEMRGLRERLSNQDLTLAGYINRERDMSLQIAALTPDMTHAAKVADEYEDRIEAAEERERQLREALGSIAITSLCVHERVREFCRRKLTALAASPARLDRHTQAGADTLGQMLSDAAKALSQPQALKYDAASGAISVDLSAHLRSPEGRAQLEQVAAVREVLAQPRPSEPLDPRPVGGIGIDQGQFEAACAAGNQVFGEGGRFGGGGDHG